MLDPSRFVAYLNPVGVHFTLNQNTAAIRVKDRYSNLDCVKVTGFGCAVKKHTINEDIEDIIPGSGFDPWGGTMPAVLVAPTGNTGFANRPSLPTPPHTSYDEAKPMEHLKACYIDLMKAAQDEAEALCNRCCCNGGVVKIHLRFDNAFTGGRLATFAKMMRGASAGGINVVAGTDFNANPKRLGIRRGYALDYLYKCPQVSSSAAQAPSNSAGE